MERILIFVVIMQCCSMAKAQPRVWIDLQAIQSVGLNTWSNDKYVADHLPRTWSTDFRGTFNWRFAPHVGLFTSMGIGIMPAPEKGSFDSEDFPSPNPGKRYYVKEVLDDNGYEKASVQFKMTFGFFGNINTSEKLSVRPYLGVGFSTINTSNYRMIIKEDGSNMLYKTECYWFRDKESNYDDPLFTLGHLNGRLNFAYKVGQRTRLLFGFEYTWIFTRADFYERSTNTFTQRVDKTYYRKGNYLNMLGISLGVSL